MSVVPVLFEYFLEEKDVEGALRLVSRGGRLVHLSPQPFSNSDIRHRTPAITLVVSDKSSRGAEGGAQER